MTLGFFCVSGEEKYSHLPESKILLSDSQKLKIRKYSFTDLFELFFSAELKNYIIEATRSNAAKKV